MSGINYSRYSGISAGDIASVIADSSFLRAEDFASQRCARISASNSRLSGLDCAGAMGSGSLESSLTASDLEFEGDSIREEGLVSASWVIAQDLDKVKNHSECAYDLSVEHYGRVLLYDAAGKYFGVAKIHIAKDTDVELFNETFDGFVRRLLQAFEQRGIKKEQLQYEMVIGFDKSQFLYIEQNMGTQIHPDSEYTAPKLGNLQSLHGMKEVSRRYDTMQEDAA